MKEDDTMEEGSPEEEAAETPQEEATEQESDIPAKGVKIPEEFQQSVHGIVSGIENMDQCNYVRQCVMDKEKELMKSSNPAPVDEYSSDDEPKD